MSNKKVRISEKDILKLVPSYNLIKEVLSKDELDEFRDEISEIVSLIRNLGNGKTNVKV